MSGNQGYQFNTDWWSDVQTMVSAAATMIPVAGALIGGLVNVFWPQPDADFWDQVKDQVQSLIDQDLQQALLQQVQKQLSGLSYVSSDYLEALQTSAGDPSTIKSSWIAASMAYDEAEPSFMIASSDGSDTDRVILLPLFAQYVNLKIALLRDVCVDGVSWGMTSDYVASKATILTQNIATYVSYATSVYQTGCALPCNDPPRDDHACQPFRNQNAYIRQTTLTVMDFVTSWPYLDLSKYPKGISYQLEREIFSDPLGTCDDSGQISLIPSWQPLPSTPTGAITFVECWVGNYLNAAQITYTANGGPGGVTKTARMGTSSGGKIWPPQGTNTAIPAGQYMMSATGYTGDVPNAFDLVITGDGSATTIQCRGTNGMGGNVTTWSYPRHVISRMHVNGVSNADDCADCIVFGFKLLQGQTNTMQGLATLYRSTPGNVSVKDFLSHVAANVATTSIDEAAWTTARLKQVDGRASNRRGSATRS